MPRPLPPTVPARSVERLPPPLPPGPLSLEQLIGLARQYNPEMPIAYARAAAARGRLIQAGLYPNPTVNWRADEVNTPDGKAGTQGPFLTQEIVTAHKLRIAQAAAAQEVAAADWQVVSRWYDLLTRIRLAYFDALTAQREVRTNEEIVRIIEQGLDVAQKLLKAGAGTRPDVLRAQVELEQSRLGLAVSRQRAAAAWRVLTAVLGLPPMPEVPLQEALDAPAPRFQWEPAVSLMLVRSSDIYAAEALVRQAEQLVRRAQVEPIPNLQLQFRPFYSFFDRREEFYVQAGGAIPLFNRNQGNILAAQADLARAQAEVRQVELRLTERLALAFQRYDIAQRQVEAYQKEILPHALESLRLVTKGYEANDPKYDYTAVLQQQRILVQVQLAYVQALGDLWRAISEIAGLLQLDELTQPHPDQGQHGPPPCLPPPTGEPKP
jgi:cobalt-zinc-cadmium efflux system outer membrane protein